MFESFALSVRGSSHIRENIARQDYTNTYTDPAGWAMAAVSDGHGGDDYFRSHIGSRFAVESAMSCIKECLAEKKILLDTLREGENAREKFFRRLASSIMTGWRAYIETFEEAVKAYDGASETAAVQFDFGALTIQQQLPGGEDAFVQDGISLAWEEAWCAEHEVKRSETRPERLYGCTLLVAVMAPEFARSGLTLREIPRLESAGAAVSASRVRALLRGEPGQAQWRELETLLSSVTYNFLRSPQGADLLRLLQNHVGRH